MGKKTLELTIELLRNLFDYRLDNYCTNKLPKKIRLD